jgi:hypothetical protein
MNGDHLPGVAGNHFPLISDPTHPIGSIADRRCKIESPVIFRIITMPGKGHVKIPERLVVHLPKRDTHEFFHTQFMGFPLFPVKYQLAELIQVCMGTWMGIIPGLVIPASEITRFFIIITATKSAEYDQ